MNSLTIILLYVRDQKIVQHALFCFY